MGIFWKFLEIFWKFFGNFSGGIKVFFGGIFLEEIFIFIYFHFLFGSKWAKYSQSIVSCSTGDTSLRDFYIMTLLTCMSSQANFI